MKKLRVPIAILAVCYVIFFACLHFTYDALPGRVASHFGLDGQPNGWMSRDALVACSLGLGILLPAIMIGMMAAAGRIPVSFVNLPHRDYWLAPERRRATSAVLLRYALWFSALNVLFVTGLHLLLVQANMVGGSYRLNGTGLLVIVGGFLLGTAVWCICLIARFAKKPDA
jgi:uncharacterized membrane protein